jgi:signal transduction histidine kinase
LPPAPAQPCESEYSPTPQNPLETNNSCVLHGRLATRDLGKAIEVRVRDNGTGIPPEIKDKPFQSFFTTKPTGEGTGLGLSISYDIITQQHGGTITVESEPGSFTEFTVRLPRCQTAFNSGSDSLSVQSAPTLVR